MKLLKRLFNINVNYILFNLLTLRSLDQSRRLKIYSLHYVTQLWLCAWIKISIAAVGCLLFMILFLFLQNDLNKSHCKKIYRYLFNINSKKYYYLTESIQHLHQEALTNGFRIRYQSSFEAETCTNENEIPLVTSFGTKLNISDTESLLNFGGRLNKEL